MPSTNDTISTLKRHRELADCAAQRRVDWEVAKHETAAAKELYDEAMAALREECCSWELSDNPGEKPKRRRKAAHPLAQKSE